MLISKGSTPAPMLKVMERTGVPEVTAKVNVHYIINSVVVRSIALCQQGSQVNRAVVNRGGDKYHRSK